MDCAVYLANSAPHQASVAFAKGSKIRDAAKPHCRSRWLIKLDVRNFFESINEIAVYGVFRSLGYQPLISFEMARICTRLGGVSRLKERPRWRVDHTKWSIEAYHVYRYGGGPVMGHLPQGAPTSPMLANLAMRSFDRAVDKIANAKGFRYTRYADDLTLSSRADGIDRAAAGHIIGLIYAAMGQVGLSPNITKTRVTSPGARKIVLGLLVDSDEPRLTREFKQTMRRHIHYVTRTDVGPIVHAYKRGFSSVLGFRNHLDGLLSFANQIEPEYADECKAALAEVTWPL